MQLKVAFLMGSQCFLILGLVCNGAFPLICLSKPISPSFLKLGGGSFCKIGGYPQSFCSDIFLLVQGQVIDHNVLFLRKFILSERAN